MGGGGRQGGRGEGQGQGGYGGGGRYERVHFRGGVALPGEGCLGVVADGMACGGSVLGLLFGQGWVPGLRAGSMGWGL